MCDLNSVIILVVSSSLGFTKKNNLSVLTTYTGCPVIRSNKR